MTIKCERCGKEVERRASQVGYSKHHYCSHLCRRTPRAKRREQWKESNRRWRHKHLDAFHRWQRKYRQEHKERVKEHGHRYYIEHREQIALRAKAYTARHRGAVKEYRRRYGELNAERLRAQRKEWKETHRTKVLADAVLATRNRRARLRRAEGRHTHDDIRRLYQSQRAQCVLCDISLRQGYEVDHIVPVSRGGSNWPSNLQLLCRTCNRKKADKLTLEATKREAT